MAASELPASELLAQVVEVLDRLRLRYFVTGSMATILYGEPRLTNDIDIVVDLPRHGIRQFCRCFPEPEFYVSVESAERAVRTGSQFNIIQPSSGLKVDVMIPSRDEFDTSRFSRVRRLEASQGVKAPFASPEDAILMKLVYFCEGGSEKHLRDIRGILEVSSDDLDIGYIERWTEDLGVEGVWQRVSKQE